MPRAFSKCHLVRLFALTTALAGVALFAAAPPARAVVPPASGSGAQMPDLPRALREAGFGHVSRPVLQAHGAGGMQEGGRQGEGDVVPAPAAIAAGVRRVPVLLGDTSDRVATQLAASLAEELFGDWPTGTMTAYYEQISFGQFSVTGDVLGWYRMAYPITYYEGAAGCNGLCTYPASAGGFVKQLVALADGAGLDWGPYDNDGPDGVPNSGDDDGYVDTVFIVHCGQGGECGRNNYIWSHSFFLSGWGTTAYTTHTPRTGGGYLRVDDYIIQPELSCDGGLIEIGVFCHEYGHALGLPDLYDTDGGGEGAGHWCVMSSGCWGGDGNSPETPVQMCAWAKAWLGWITPQNVPYDGLWDLPAIQTHGIARRAWQNAEVGAEYFLVENRQRVLNDVDLPGSGLLIWHVDEQVIDDNWTTNTINAGPVYGVSLEQADGLFELEAGRDRGDAGDPWPGASLRAVFDDATVPGTRRNDGQPTYVAVQDIPASAGLVSPMFIVGVPAGDLTAPVVAVLSPNGGETWPTDATRAVTWDASDASGVAEVALYLSRDSGVTWPETLATGLANSGSWAWHTPDVPAASLRVRAVARDGAGNESADGSDAAFAITDQTAPGVVLTSPDGGELWSTSSTQTVSWSASDNVAVQAVDLFLSLDGGATFPDTLALDLIDSGTWSWLIPRRFSSDCRLLARARDAAGNAGVDTSAVFTLANLTAVSDAPVRMAVRGFPNPFNPATTIYFDKPSAGRLDIVVHDLVGRRVRTLLGEVRPAGPGSVRWDGRDDRGVLCASGVYHVQANASDGYRAWVKVTLVR